MTGMLSIAIAGLVGAVIGSFLNVCIYRLPHRRSVVWPHSSCGACGQRIAWVDNIPIVSYLMLRGRCRACRASIAVQYPIVEIVTAGMFAAAWWYYGPGMLVMSRLLFGCALIVLFAIDLEHHLLPNVITLPGIATGFLFSFVAEPGWRASLIGAVLGGGVLFLIAEGYYRLRHEEGLGMGDVKMLAMVGALLGWQLTFVTLMLGSLAGSIVGLGLIASSRGGMKYALPFGTFLAMGAALAATVGDGILNWYLNFLR